MNDDDDFWFLFPLIVGGTILLFVFLMSLGGPEVEGINKKCVTITNLDGDLKDGVYCYQEVDPQ